MKLVNISNHIYRFSMIFAFIFCLSSCSTYSKKWICPNAKGSPCEMLSTIDEKINSGEISEVYKIKCKGKNCTNDAILPSKKDLKAKKYEPQSGNDLIIEEDNQFDIDEKL